MLDGDIAERRSAQHGGNPAALAQPERRRTGPVIERRERHPRDDRGARHQDLLVAARFCQHEGKSTPGANAAGNVGERGRRVGEQHHTHPAVDEIAGAGREAVHLGVVVVETDIGQSLLLGAAGAWRGIAADRSSARACPSIAALPVTRVAGLVRSG